MTQDPTFNRDLLYPITGTGRKGIRPVPPNVKARIDQMDLDLILRLIRGTAILLMVVWVICFAMIDARDAKGNKTARRFFFNLRPFIPVLNVGDFIAGAIMKGTDDLGFRIGVLGFVFFVWWLSRFEDDDDDRWRKRLDSLNARVAVVFNRLRIVPT